jgi:hypothetical protein
MYSEASQALLADAQDASMRGSIHGDLQVNISSSHAVGNLGTTSRSRCSDSHRTRPDVMEMAVEIRSRVIDVDCADMRDADLSGTPSSEERAYSGDQHILQTSNVKKACRNTVRVMRKTRL